jgi:hypothetical protein
MFRLHTGISDDEEERKKKSRFAVTTEEDVLDMITKKNSKNTDVNTMFATNILDAFCKDTCAKLTKTST